MTQRKKLNTSGLLSRRNKKIDTFRPNNKGLPPVIKPLLSSTHSDIIKTSSWI